MSAASATNNQSAVLIMRKSPTLTNPTWLAVNGTVGAAPTTLTAAQSVAFVDTAATWTAPTTNPGTPGTSNVLWTGSAGPNGSVVVDLTPFDIFILPGEYLTLSGTGTGTVSITATLNWQEDT